MLSSIPIYFLSAFKCPVAVVKHIEKIQCDFLWNAKGDKRKFHLVSWDQVCRLLSCGGLVFRIRSI